MARFAIPLMIVSLMLEYVFMYLFTKQYAKLACVPFLRREEPLTQRVAVVGYRDVLVQPWTVSELGLDGLRHEDDDSVGAWEGGVGWLRMKYKFFGWNRTMGVLAIVPTISGDTLRLDAKMFPAFGVSILPMVFMMPEPRFAAIMLVGVLLGIGFSLLMLRQRARAPISVFLDRIEARAQQTLGRQRQ